VGSHLSIIVLAQRAIASFLIRELISSDWNLFEAGVFR